MYDVNMTFCCPAPLLCVPLLLALAKPILTHAHTHTPHTHAHNHHAPHWPWAVAVAGRQLDRWRRGSMERTVGPDRPPQGGECCRIALVWHRVLASCAAWQPHPGGFFASGWFCIYVPQHSVLPGHCSRPPARPLALIPISPSPVRRTGSGQRVRPTLVGRLFSRR